MTEINIQLKELKLIGNYYSGEGINIQMKEFTLRIKEFTLRMKKFILRMRNKYTIDFEQYL